MSIDEIARNFSKSPGHFLKRPSPECDINKRGRGAAKYELGVGENKDMKYVRNKKNVKTREKISIL